MPAQKHKMTEAERSRRFVEKAKEIGADESTEGLRFSAHGTWLR
jgi:hypothetical protein